MSTAVAATDEVARLKRRLFRTLDCPQRPFTLIDCEQISAEQLQASVQGFFSNDALNEQSNLVLAIPTHQQWSNSESAQIMEALKQEAFERGLDGKISWLLIHEPHQELPALISLVKQQANLSSSPSPATGLAVFPPVDSTTMRLPK